MIYVLTAVHNRRAVTARFVECLSCQTCKDFHLVLVDSGSTDGTACMVRERMPEATVLQGADTLWWAGGLQCALDWLQGQQVRSDDLILFINDDVTFGPRYLAAAQRLMASRPDALVLSQLEQPDGTARQSGVHANLRELVFEIAKDPTEVNCLSTEGLFVHRRHLQALGGFHPRLLPHYLSDYEFTLRAHRIGLRCETSPELLIRQNTVVSGHRNILAYALSWQQLRHYFSRRHVDNPLYWTSFVLLASPARWMPRNLLLIWTRAARFILRGMSGARALRR